MNRNDFLEMSSFAAMGMATTRAAAAFASFDEKIRVGIIGTGDRGTGLASGINAINDLTVIAGCDILPFRLDAFVAVAGKGVKTYQDYRKMLDNKDVDAVIIASPLYLHKQMVFDAIDAGKHIYCEKTMTYNTEEAIQVAKKVRSSRKVFQVGHQYRNYPLYSTVYEKIKAGDIGEVKHFICDYNLNSQIRRPVPDPKLERTINWRMYREYSGGLTAELSSHQIDAINYLLDGHPIKITGFGSINQWKDGREIFDNINLVMEYPQHITGTVSCHLSNAHQAYVIKVLGTKGSIEIHRDKAFYYPEQSALAGTPKQTAIVDGVSGATLNTEHGKAYPVKVELKQGYDATTYALLDFVTCIRSNKIPESNIETGRMAAITVDMANSAMENGGHEYWKPEYDS